MVESQVIAQEGYSSVQVLCEEGDFPVTADDIRESAGKLGYKTNVTANKAIEAVLNPQGDTAQEYRLAIAGITHVGLYDRPGERAVSGSSLVRASYSTTIYRAVRSDRVATLLHIAVLDKMNGLGVAYSDLT